MMPSADSRQMIRIIMVHSATFDEPIQSSAMKSRLSQRSTSFTGPLNWNMRFITTATIGIASTKGTKTMMR